MLQDLLFTWITRLLGSRWVRDYQEHNGRCEDVTRARLGPLLLATHHCFVLDHADASITLHLPLPGRRLEAGVTVCRGTEQVRQPGCFLRLAPPR